MCVTKNAIVVIFISDWLRNRNTLEFLGIWERIYNPLFNYGEFAIIKSQAGLNRFKISVKEWQQTHPRLKGNIRDYASGAQLVCLTNLESLNSIMINEGKSPKERIKKLNEIAIYQMTILTEDKRTEDMNLIIQNENEI